MKRFFLILLSILILSCGSENPSGTNNKNSENTFLQTFGGSYNEYIASIIQTSDNGFVIAGSFNSNDGDFEGLNRGVDTSRIYATDDIFIIKLDSDGNSEWMETFGGSGGDTVVSLIKTSDMGFMIAGVTRSTDGDFIGPDRGPNDVFLIKLDANGKKQWINTYGGSTNDFFSAIFQTLGGGYIITGRSQSNDGDFEGLHEGYLHDLYLMKLNANGAIAWVKSYEGFSNYRINSIIQLENGNYVVSGTLLLYEGRISSIHDILLMGFDINGNILWTKRYSGSSSETTRSMIMTQDGGYIIDGSTSSTDGDFVELNTGGIFLLKHDSKSTKQWMKSISIDKIITSFKQTSDGGYVLTALGTGDIRIIKLNADTEMLWEKNHGGSSGESGSQILQTSDGGYVITGRFGSNDGIFLGLNKGESDIFILKLNSFGELN